MDYTIHIVHATKKSYKKVFIKAKSDN